MELITGNKYKSLIILALFSGLFWRLELEYHGWRGLLWLGSPNNAVPISYCLFLIWSLPFIKLKVSLKILFYALIVLLTLISVYSIMLTIQNMYLRGPLGLIRMFERPSIIKTLIRNSAFFILPLTSVASFYIIKAFKLSIKLKSYLLAIIGVIVSFPISIFLLYITDHKGGADVIHSIKSGFVIPFLVFSFGLFVLGISNNAVKPDAITNKDHDE
tara:strand:- start:837 stop:1484 length:648 start_codon:yes stop_codon:yes gene_type:complete